MKLFRLVFLVFAFLILTGCFRTELNAPPDREVRILSPDQPTAFKTEYKNWYLLYGFLPIWTTQPEEIIEKENLVEVRAQTQDTISDSIITAISMLLPVVVFPQHVILEGNRESDIQKREP